ncbi:maleylpyruvate isomerase family mycothiol-dependent enzyme [Arthrobacter sp. NamB2]|uniref:maleylpyruvate isomerase family mycothiol-dependent enzyme n=1 Tax=Arthrobacter sp. NamB2 TaxID=2576035 RepID=UPI0010C9A0EB|nr:maleylpyruvate isomerase family mycothiol-dependent enzyme [Arthrobacter sp. NamB2]TKV29607.1 maleylpyruvate isomerase family mycothiol-dependent enzyme [Arthrobacter sp. NamB2]
MISDWHTVHQQRQALADDLASLTDAQWATPSLCQGWDVHDVVAHLTGSAGTTHRSFWLSLIRSGFDFDRANAREVETERAPTPAETLQRFESTITSTRTPPGPFITRLIEIVVHGEDIRRPLGIEHAALPSKLREAVAYFAQDRLSGGKKRLTGLELTATDEGFTLGSGQMIAGPALSLLLAASGRPAALHDLRGPGVALLRSRLNL